PPTIRSASGSSSTNGRSRSWCAARRIATRCAVTLGRSSLTAAPTVSIERTKAAGVAPIGRPPPRAAWALLRRLDVLIETEHVLGIVLALEFLQPGVLLGAVGHLELR